jgi:hypothetical protein
LRQHRHKLRFAKLATAIDDLYHPLPCRQSAPGKITTANLKYILQYPMDITRTVIAWLPMPFIGIANGVLRQFFLLQYFSNFRAHQVSTLTLILVLIVYIAIIYKKLSIKSANDAWLTGTCWALLTVLFEMAMGHFVSHLSLAEMLAAYNLGSGNLWSLVPLILFIIPFAFYRLLR